MMRYQGKKEYWRHLLCRTISFLHSLEEYVIFVLFVGMVVISFSQVVARYVFSGGWIAALELTIIFFAWFIMLGISYTLRVSSHLGVDVFLRVLPNPVARTVTVLGAWSCTLYALMLIDASWLNWIFDSDIRGGAIFYVEKIKSVDLRTEDLSMPRWIVYIVMPIGLALFAWRAFWAGILIIRGERESIIGGHGSVDDDQNMT